MNMLFAREVGLPKYFSRRLALFLLHQIPRRVARLRLPTGLDMILPCESFFGRDVYVTNAQVDWGSEALFCRHLDAAGDFVDAGANIGYYSLYAAPLVRRVFSFEPDARNHPALEANAATAGNVLIRKAALSNVTGGVALDVSANPEVSKIVLATPGGTDSAAVHAITLDDFANEQPELRMTGLKIDTEGHELEILRGGHRTILRDQPLILVELMHLPGQGGEKDFARLAEFAEATGHSLFAFTPGESGLLRAARFRLVPLPSAVTFAAHATKMIFLVPARLRPVFEAECNRR